MSLSSSAALRMARQFALAVLMAIRTPRIPKTTVVQEPQPCLVCSQLANNRKKQGGNRMDRPNCVTHINRDKTFMVPPVMEVPGNREDQRDFVKTIDNIISNSSIRCKDKL